jgi:ketosteroid isomerase-like protein
MSQENVELYRAVLEEFRVASGGSDWEPWLARMTDVLDPEIEWDASGSPIPGLGGVHRGREAVVRWWREWLAAWQTVEFEYELVDAGDRVVVLLDQRMRGRSTGIEVELGKYAHVATVKNGRMVHWRAYPSHARALEAVGLAENAMSDENIERLRAQLEEWDPKAQTEAWKRGEAVGDLSLIDPEVTFEDRLLPDHVGETYHGYEGLGRATEQWMEPYESVEIELERIVGTGERLVSIHRARFKARRTGIEFESPLAYVWTFRDRKVVHIHGYFDPAKALEAAGLRA